MRIGTGDTTYEWVGGWARIPDTPSARDGWSHHGAVFTDDGEVIAFHQGEPTMTVFDRDGKLLRTWETDLNDAHGMALAADDSGQYLWTADPGAKRQANLGYEYPDGPRKGRFVKWSLDGKKVMELARPDISAYESGVFSPTSVTVFEERGGGNGDIWASDGYGESLIHRYNRDGEYLSTIDGTEGSAGHFDCPHCVWVDYRHDEPELYIADRGNAQMQVYDLEGNFIRSFGKDFLTTPTAIATHGGLLFVAELRSRITIIDTSDQFVGYLGPDDAAFEREGWPNRRDENGNLQRPDTLRDGVFNSPHGIAADPDGNLYVAEWLIGGRFTKLARV